MSQIQYKDGDYGPCAVLTTEVNPAILEELHRKGITHLILNFVFGWRGESLDFLEELPNLLALEVIPRELQNPRGIENLHCLRYLSLQSYDLVPVDFSKLLGIEQLTVYGKRKGIPSAFSLPKLHKLFIYESRPDAIEGIENAKELRSLRLGKVRLSSFEHISKLVNLETIRFADSRKLTSLNGIHHLRKLMDCQITACPCGATVNEIEWPSSIRYLLLNSVGDIPSLDFVTQLPHLELISFHGTTNILDGRLQILDRLPKRGLRKGVFLKNRQHYSHNSKDFG